MNIANRISTTLMPADREAVMTAISTMRSRLPFLINLTPEERKTLLKLGDRSRAFVLKALELATQNQGFLPKDFDVEEMRKDVTLLSDLYAVKQSLNTLSELVDDSYTAVGNEAYSAALLVYSYAKSSNVGTAGLDNVLDELAVRFARKSRPAPAK
jgi:hypothetical protein